MTVTKLTSICSRKSEPTNHIQTVNGASPHEDREPTLDRLEQDEDDQPDAAASYRARQGRDRCRL